MKLSLLIILFFTTARAMDPDVISFNAKLVKFDEPYLKFRRIYCSIPDHPDTEKVPCVMGDIFPYAEWKAAREAAKRLFKLQEKN